MKIVGKKNVAPQEQEELKQNTEQQKIQNLLQDKGLDGMMIAFLEKLPLSNDPNEALMEGQEWETRTEWITDGKKVILSGLKPYSIADIYECQLLRRVNAENATFMLRVGVDQRKESSHELLILEAIILPGCTSQTLAKKIEEIFVNQELKKRLNSSLYSWERLGK